jgi:hypothetical protein
MVCGLFVVYGTNTNSTYATFCVVFILESYRLLGPERTTEGRGCLSVYTPIVPAAISSVTYY